MKLKNWFTEEHNHHLVLYGNVYDDETGRFKDGANIKTSRVENVEDWNGKIIVTTHDNKYELLYSDLQEVKITYSNKQKKYEFLWK